MLLNIDSTLGSVESLVPWDFQVQVGGVAYDTRRPSVGEIAEIEAIPNINNNAGLDVIRRLIFKAAPDMAGWEDSVLTGVVIGYLNYFNQRAEKNSEAISSMVKLAMAKQIG